MLVQATNMMMTSSTKGAGSVDIPVVDLTDSLGKLQELGTVSAPEILPPSLPATTEESKPAGEAKISAAERKKLAEAKALERERKKAEKEAELRQKEADKERLKAAKELEKQQRELEKQRKEQEKQQKEMEKQQKRAEKEAEKNREAEKRKAEKEAEKTGRKAREEAKQAGFGDLKAMNRSKTLLMSFLKKEPKDSAQQKPVTGTSSQQQSSSSSCVCIETSLDKRVELDKHLSCPLSPRSLTSAFEQFKISWRSQRGNMRQPKGVPPTWARKPNACMDFFTLAAQYYGENVDLATVTTWRRKLLQHWDSQRPAYYGSFSKKSSAVCGRRPFAKDPTLDYEVMSDEDWEDEGDGESLASQDDDEDREKEKEEEEEEDGFVVEDGHLSDDEGIVVDECDDGVLDDRAAGGAAGGSSKRADPKLHLLEGALERARRSNRPLILCTLPSIQYEPTTQLDPAVLSALAGTWLTPNIVIKTPVPATQASPTNPVLQGQPKEGEQRPEARSGSGRPRQEMPPALQQELLEFLGSTTLVALDKVVSAFVGLHPDKGLSKQGVRRKLKEVACYNTSLHKWVIKQTPGNLKRTPPKRPNPNRLSSSQQDEQGTAKRARLSPGAANQPRLATARPASPAALAVPPIQRFFKSITNQTPVDRASQPGSATANTAGHKPNTSPHTGSQPNTAPPNTKSTNASQSNSIQSNPMQGTVAHPHAIQPSLTPPSSTQPSAVQLGCAPWPSNPHPAAHHVRTSQLQATHFNTNHTPNTSTLTTAHLGANPPLQTQPGTAQTAPISGQIVEHPGHTGKPAGVVTCRQQQTAPAKPPPINPEAPHESDAPERCELDKQTEARDSTVLDLTTRLSPPPTRAPHCLHPTPLEPFYTPDGEQGSKRHKIGANHAEMDNDHSNINVDRSKMDVDRSRLPESGVSEGAVLAGKTTATAGARVMNESVIVLD